MMLPAPRQAALIVLFACAALLGGALVFQYLGGYAPCVLCHWQRYAHAGAIVFALGALVVPRVTLLLVAAGLALLAGAGIAFFHIGVEQHWWQGTAGCGSAVGGASSIEELRARLLAQPVVRCDEVQWLLFGLSMASYNFIVSLVLGLLAVANPLFSRRPIR